jgi:hypothetical protein
MSGRLKPSVTGSLFDAKRFATVGAELIFGRSLVAGETTARGSPFLFRFFVLVQVIIPSLLLTFCLCILSPFWRELDASSDVVVWLGWSIAWVGDGGVGPCSSRISSSTVLVEAEVACLYN